MHVYIYYSTLKDKYIYIYGVIVKQNNYKIIDSEVIKSLTTTLSKM